MTESAMTPRQLGEAFRKRAQELIALADQVEREAPLLNQAVSTNGTAGSTRRRGGQKKNKSRRELELIKFLEKVGPSTFKRLKEDSGIPTGTIVALLRKSSFKKDANELWTVVD